MEDEVMVSTKSTMKYQLIGELLKKWNETFPGEKVHFDFNYQPHYSENYHGHKYSLVITIVSKVIDYIALDKFCEEFKNTFYLLKY